MRQPTPEQAAARLAILRHVIKFPKEARVANYGAEDLLVTIGYYKR
jgi:hypothetical protein